MLHFYHFLGIYDVHEVVLVELLYQWFVLGALAILDQEHVLEHCLVDVARRLLAGVGYLLVNAPVVVSTIAIDIFFFLAGIQAVVNHF